MKKIVLFFLIINSISFKTQEIDKTYYLLGAVDEYMGRSYEMKNPNWKGFLLKIHDNDSLQIKRIETITEIKPKKINIEFYNEWNFFFSEELEKNINSYFNFKKNKFKQENNYYLNTGKLNVEKVLKASENQYLSYLLGVFLLHGKINKADDGLYEISISNASYKFQVLKKIIPKLNAYFAKEEIWYKTPVTFHIKFMPNEELKNLLDKELTFQTKNN
jgi:hypothetical protein